ncbi:MAG: Na+/H+ antiporter subunit E [Halieaceae bacterium]|nr:Na+/H+ antiporter subunit E [Halieaceae bacterium]
MSSAKSPAPLRTGATRAAVYALLWGVLTGFQPDSWLLGGPAVLLATWLSLALLPPVAFRPLPVPGLLAYFTWHSVLGAVDVARRALAPRLQIAPTLISYKTSLPAGLPRVLFLNTISLTPGTLGADLQDDMLFVHVIDAAGDHDTALAGLEARLMQVFPA